MKPPLLLLIGATGGFILADSISQLAVATAPWQPGSIAWRATTLRMLFTQITPLALAALLLGITLIRSETALRPARTVLFLLALVVFGLGVLLWVQGQMVGGTGDPVPDRRFARGQAQALISAAACWIGLVAAGVRLGSASRRVPVSSPTPAAGAE
jgi:hypothetical protein